MTVVAEQVTYYSFSGEEERQKILALFTEHPDFARMCVHLFQQSAEKKEELSQADTIAIGGYMQEHSKDDSFIEAGLIGDELWAAWRLLGLAFLQLAADGQIKLT